MAHESNFPTIRDLRDALSRLVDQGLGDQAAQIIIVPDSTLQAISRIVAPAGYSHDKPALMIEFGGVDGRMPVLVYSTDRAQGREMKSRTAQ